LPKFFEILSKFLANQNFWGAVSPPAPTPLPICICRSHSSLRHCMYGIAASPASYCDCYLTGTWSAWSSSWLAIVASP